MRFRLALICVGLTVLLALALAVAPVDFVGALSYAADHPFGVALALVAYTGAFALRAASWRPLVAAPVSRMRLFTLLMGALFLNHAAPAKAGDFARMYAISRRGMSAEEAVVSVLVSRVVDLAGLLVVLGVALTLAGGYGWERAVLPALPIVGAIAALPALSRLRLRLPKALRGSSGRLAALALRAGRARAALRDHSPGVLLRSFAFAVPAWVLEAGILWAIGRGLEMGLSPAQVVAATCFAVLVAAVPLTPGSLGTYEAGMVAILLAFGASLESAFAAAVATHAMKFLYAFAAAPFAFGEGLAAVRKGGANEAGLQL